MTDQTPTPGAAVGELVGIVHELSSIVAELASLVTIFLVRDVPGSPISYATPDELKNMAKHALDQVARAKVLTPPEASDG